MGKSFILCLQEKPFNISFGDGDIYKALYIDSAWLAPEYVTQINTENGEDEPSVSYDGEKIYFQSWLNYWESTGGPYYEAEISNGKLKNIKGLGGGINQFFRKHYRINMGYATDGMAVSPDGNLLLSRVDLGIKEIWIYISVLKSMVYGLFLSF